MTPSLGRFPPTLYYCCKVSLIGKKDPPPKPDHFPVQMPKDSRVRNENPQGLSGCLAWATLPALSPWTQPQTTPPVSLAAPVGTNICQSHHWLLQADVRGKSRPQLQLAFPGCLSELGSDGLADRSSNHLAPGTSGNSQSSWGHRNSVFPPHICFSFHLRALQLIRPQLSHSEYLDLVHS